MYGVYYESGEKAFGCSSLSALVDYITEIGVANVWVKARSNARGWKEICINLCNGEHAIVDFPCSTTADSWIRTCIPGTLKEIASRRDGCDYIYEEVVG